jgi:hypothetical protein
LLMQGARKIGFRQFLGAVEQLGQESGTTRGAPPWVMAALRFKRLAHEQASMTRMVCWHVGT